ncbi:MAG TPA: GNAT family N-acetyltransferase, partial [Verrucomicrobiae bacterium]|nr:GNAT family N-acetyltransferase [Verrucomicrobiae bacterium]
PASVQREIVEKMLNPGSIDPNKFYLFTALDRDKVIGIACFYWLPGVNMAYLEHIGITPEYQKRGIGSFFYHKVISFLEKTHPDIEGVLLEVRPNKEDLDNRKDFFLNLGAIPIDTNFYPSDKLKLGQEVLLMFKPETADARLNTVAMELALQSLSKIL